MRDEYDFSKGKRGTYPRDLKDLHLPIYLDPQLEEYYKKIARKKNKDLSSIINAILQKEMELHDSLSCTSLAIPSVSCCLLFLARFGTQRSKLGFLKFVNCLLGGRWFVANATLYWNLGIFLIAISR